MALQTFTTGQVLTAAQVTALQANDYNQTVSTKTANYVLTIADLGSRVFMNAAGSTTITVNTGIFAAGDTLWIGNIGAGATVVTAGTATVSKFSTASLTLSQYQGAFLYFVSTGVAILYSDSAGASTPLTTKGDLFTYSTANDRLPVGANGSAVVADSTQATGLNYYAKGVFNGLTTTGDTIYSSSGTTQSRLGIGSTGQVLTVAAGVPSWATPTAGSLTLLSTTTASGTSTTISSISTAYSQLQITIEGIYPTSSTEDLKFTVNGNTGTIYNVNLAATSGTALNAASTGASAKAILENVNTAGNTTNYALMYFPNYASTTANKVVYGPGVYQNSSSVHIGLFGFGFIQTTTAITSIAFKWGNAGTLTFSAGTIKIYGVN